jgi:hypothetical protein
MRDFTGAPENMGGGMPSVQEKSVILLLKSGMDVLKALI